MKRFSFRVKVISTVVIGVSFFSILAFSIYNLMLQRKLTELSRQNLQHINLLRDQYYFSIRSHDGGVIPDMLKSLEQDHHVLHTYLINDSLRMVYPGEDNSGFNHSDEVSAVMKKKQDITVLPHREADTPFNRVYIRMTNQPACHSCHNAKLKTLGLIVMDIDDRETGKLLNFTWRFSLIYTVCLLLAIFVLVAYLHLRYVRRSLFLFRKTIERINRGDLSIRLDIPEANELGTLGLSFNEMLDTFEDTQVQLQAYHRQELQTSKKLATIGEMSARIAHEIRNPVTGIARAMEIIMADLRDESNKPILEEIQRQAGRVEDAVSNLLKYSRSQEPRMSPGDVNEVIRSLVFFLQHQAHDKAVQFEFEPGSDIPRIEFDPELIENVLLNLSFNAIKSMGPDGKILFSTKYDSERQRILILVKDSGSGIAPDVAGDIFKPFFTTHTKGTGLGLAISKDIVEKHGGRIWFENNRNGVGCTFFVELPQHLREN